MSSDAQAALPLPPRIAAPPLPPRTNAAPLPPSPQETDPWDVDAATALLCLAACSLRDDGEQDAWNRAYINAAAAAVGAGAVPHSLEHASWAAALRPLTRADTRKARDELASMLRERATDAAFAATLRRKVLEGLLAAPLVHAKGAYDARARRCVARVAAALDYDRGWLRQSERAVAVALQNAAGPAPTVKRRESNAAAALRYAAIGAAATATGVAVAVTAGVAAPALAVALGGSTVWGASTVVTFTTTYSLFFAAGFGAAGAGLAGYRTSRCVAGLTDFEIVRGVAPSPEASGLTVAVCVAGSMRDPTDYAATYGADNPANAPLKRKLRRLLQQKEALAAAAARDRARSVLLAAKTGQSFVARRRPSQIERLQGRVAQKSEATLEERCRALLSLAPDASLDAAPPPEALTPLLDESIAREAANALEAAVARASAPDGLSALDVVQGDASTLVRQALALRADEAVDVDLTALALEKCDEEAAQKRNAVDAERIAGLDETGAEEARPPPVGDNDGRDPVEDNDGRDVELWWWPQAWSGGAPELNLLIWERRILVEITASMAALASSLAQSAAQDTIMYGAAATTTGLILTTLMLPIALLQATKYIDGTWTLAVTRADAAGVALADVLCARHDIGERPVTLVGYSLGARVVFSCLEELTRRHARAQKRCRRREKRRARAASVIGVGAHAGGSSSDVGVLSDEEDVDDEEHLHGTLTIAPLDGIHWIDAASGRRLRLAVRAGAGCGYSVGSNAKISSRAQRLFGSSSDNDEPDALLAGGRDLRAEPGEPIVWCGPDNISASIEIDCAARDAVIDIALVASSSSYETTATHCVLAANRFPAWARTQAARDDPAKPMIRLAALADATGVSVTVRVEVSWKDAEAHAAQNRSRDSFRGIVEHAVVMGAPLRGTGGSTTERWRAASSVVAGRLVNCYSPNDLMLAVLFRMQSWASKVAGLAPLSLPGFAVDVDVSDLISAHADYGLKVREILDRVDLEDAARDDDVFVTAPAAGRSDAGLGVRSDAGLV